METPARDNLAPALAELENLAADCAQLRESARLVLKGIEDALRGRVVIDKWGKRWSIAQVRIGLDGAVQFYAVTINKRGKIGTRYFDKWRLNQFTFETKMESDDER